MSDQQLRYRVSDMGFAFAVFDTQAPRDYGFEAGKDKEHPSTNAFNSKRVDMFPTRDQAQMLCDELNRKAG